MRSRIQIAIALEMGWAPELTEREVLTGLKSQSQGQCQARAMPSLVRHVSKSEAIAVRMVARQIGVGMPEAGRLSQIEYWRPLRHLRLPLVVVLRYSFDTGRLIL